jgi:hypothetical protein
MLRYRHKTWFRFLSGLILAVFLQAEAAGCCKIGSWFPLFPLFQEAAKSAASESMAAASAGTMDHSCCPKPATGEADVSMDGSAFSSRFSSFSAERACCLQGAELNAVEIVSLHDGSPAHIAMPAFPRVLEILTAPRSQAFAASAFLDSGPPASRSALPLLI